MPSGYSSSLPADVILDSGVLYVAGVPWGVSRGALRFTPEVEWRTPQYDGGGVPIVGMDRIVMRGATISGTMLALGSASLLRLVENNPATGVGGTNYRHRNASVFLTLGSYIADVVVRWLRGNGGYVEVQFPYVRVAYSIAGEDAAEGTIDLTLEARQSVAGAATVESAPYVIRMSDSPPPVTTVPTAPAAPSGLTGTMTGTGANLSWTDNSANEVTFRVERANGINATTGFVEIGSTLASVVTYNDTTAIAVTPYTWRVKARNVTGDSAYTATFSGTTLAAGFDPADIAGLIMRLDADDLNAQADASLVPTWKYKNDATRSFGNTVVAEQMTLRKLAINGHSAVEGAIGKKLSGSAMHAALAAITTYSVLRIGPSAAPRYVLSMGTDTNAIIFGYTANSFEYYATPRTVLRTAVADPGYQIVKSAVGSTAVTNAWSVNSNGNAASPDAGVMFHAYHLVYSGAHTIAQQTQVTDWLTARFGVT